MTAKIRTLILPFTIAILAIALASCNALSLVGFGDPNIDQRTPTVPSGGPGPGRGLATVQEVEVRILESFPAQVEVVARGYFPDSCTSLENAVKERQDSTFRVAIFTKHTGGSDCAQAVYPFEQVFALDVLGLKAGRYTVDVNGVQGQFEFLVDNQPVTATASLGGRLWHDLCSVAGGQGGVPAVPLPECVRSADGSYRADGVFGPAEPAIGGVLVSLGVGACPASGFASTVTGSDGAFLFGNLESGAYCVSIDPLQGPNAPILVPGDWTYPAGASAVAVQTVTLQTGEARRDLNFGWDYQNLPAPPVLPTPTVTPSPTPKPTPCDWVGFVKDVSVADGSGFGPGEKFTKIWRLKNLGTCTWNADYDLVFASGDRMGGAEAIALPGVVKPGETVDLSVNLTAPEKVGKFRGYWQLRNAQGVLFGLGKEARDRFWVDIQVADIPYKRVYNFADRYCDAKWQSGAGNLPCPGSTDSTAGFVMRLDRPALENRREDESTLWVHPNHDGSRWIQGTFPAFEVKEGDHFGAWVGCLEGNQGCQVEFELGVIKSDGNYERLGSWREVYDGKVTIIDMDLSSLAGKNVSFVLKMTGLNDQLQAANGFWFIPNIDRPASNFR